MWIEQIMKQYNVPILKILTDVEKIYLVLILYLYRVENSGEKLTYRRTVVLIPLNMKYFHCHPLGTEPLKGHNRTAIIQGRCRSVFAYFELN